jgi:RimJ/RimL family protein N-acetyltransferase
MNNWPEKVELKGKLATLIPLECSHEKDLLLATSDGKLWELWYTSVPSAHSIKSYIDQAIKERSHRQAIPFVIIDNASGKVIGSTRFCSIDHKNKRLEIGYTWYAKSFQRTGTNTECKLLLLAYAFETLGAIAVEFKTNWHNQPSKIAIERLGAKQDGVLRNHRIDEEGIIRDTVIYSILDTEWKGVKKSLEFNMQRYSSTLT